MTVRRDGQTLRGASFLLGLLVLVAGTAVAQNMDGGGNPPQGQPGQQYGPVPNQPAGPAYPTLERRQNPQDNAAAPGADPAGQNPAARPQPQPPFVLSPQEEAQLNQVLQAWEQRGQEVHKFDCKFTRFRYDPVWGKRDENGQPIPFKDMGDIHYAAPDKGSFHIPDGDRQERWICDGKAIFQYDFRKKQVLEYRLPPELQGKAISDGPLPFLFGSTANQLRQRYYLKMTQVDQAKKEIWLLALPRFQRDAANFSQAEIILSFPSMQPAALQLFQPNKVRDVYVLADSGVNKTDLRRIFEDVFNARVPMGWQKVVEDTASGKPQNGPMGPRPPASFSSRPVESR